MRTNKPMTGRQLAAWCKSKGAEDLGRLFEENVVEAYDHKDLDTATARLAMIENLEKKYRNKRLAVVTIVLDAR